VDEIVLRIHAPNLTTPPQAQPLHPYALQYNLQLGII
jgi:hypothetical protein